MNQYMNILVIKVHVANNWNEGRSSDIMKNSLRVPLSMRQSAVHEEQSTRTAVHEQLVTSVLHYFEKFYFYFIFIFILTFTLTQTFQKKTEMSTIHKNY